MHGAADARTPHPDTLPPEKLDLERQDLNHIAARKDIGTLLMEALLCSRVTTDAALVVSDTGADGAEPP